MIKVIKQILKRKNFYAPSFAKTGNNLRYLTTKDFSENDLFGVGGKFVELDSKNSKIILKQKQNTQYRQNSNNNNDYINDLNQIETLKNDLEDKYESVKLYYCFYKNYIV